MQPDIAQTCKALKQMCESSAYSYLPKNVQDQVLSAFRCMDGLRLGIHQLASQVSRNSLMESVKKQAVHFVWWGLAGGDGFPISGQAAIDMHLADVKAKIAAGTPVDESVLGILE